MNLENTLTERSQTQRPQIVYYLYEMSRINKSVDRERLMIAKDVAKYPTMNRTSQNYSVQNVNSTEVEKLCSKVKFIY